MLKVLPVQSKLTQEELCLKCGIKYDADTLAYEATVDGRFAGLCQFKVTDKGGLIYDLVPAPDFDNFEAMFVMGRGALNFIDLCGVKTAVYSPEEGFETRIARSIGFKEENGVLTAHLEGMFDGKCEGHCEG